MEFKGWYADCIVNSCCVDIGTEWNLKYAVLQIFCRYSVVDIGTEWNLKATWSGLSMNPAIVDIGTEWNLKELFRTAVWLLR